MLGYDLKETLACYDVVENDGILEPKKTRISYSEIVSIPVYEIRRRRLYFRA